MDKFEDVKADDLSDVGGFDLTSHTNMIVNLSAEDSDVSIKDFNCMKPGKVYMIVAENGESTQNELVFLLPLLCIMAQLQKPKQRQLYISFGRMDTLFIVIGLFMSKNKI